MSELATTTPLVSAEEPARRSLSRRVLSNPLGLASVLLLTVLILAAVFAPLLTTVDPNAASARDVLAPASAAHPLGADSAGRDILARLLFGARFSLAGALVTLLMAAVIGITAGLLAGYYGKWFDNVSSWLAGLLMALPGMVVLLAARAAFGPSLWLSMFIFGILISPAFFRLIYSSVRAVRNELYVDAARVSGLSDARIVGRHILSVVRAPIVIQSAVVAAIAIGVQAGLEFLGLGDMSVPTWGSMLNDGFSALYRSPVLIVWPSSIIGLTTIALALLANSVRDELEGAPKARKRTNPATNPGTTIPEPVIEHGDPAGTDAATELLAVRGLSVAYDRPDSGVKTVVQDVALTVNKGEIHGLIGESGSGKTQTAFSILQLLPAGGRIMGGSIVFADQDLATVSERSMTRIRGRRIAYIPQEPMSNLDPSFTIGTQLTQPMRYALGLSRKEAKTRALELLSRVGIPHPERTFNAYPHEVSGGMAQRVLIAGAVSCDPELLIADEPTTALDVTVQAEVLDLLRDLQKERNMGILLVTHNFGVVADLCDRVSVMQNGRIIETGPVRAIFSGARHPYTRALLDSILEDGPARAPLRATRATTSGGTP